MKKFIFKVKPIRMIKFCKLLAEKNSQFLTDRGYLYSDILDVNYLTDYFREFAYGLNISWEQFQNKNIALDLWYKFGEMPLLALGFMAIPASRPNTTSASGRKLRDCVTNIFSDAFEFPKGNSDDVQREMYKILAEVGTEIMQPRYGRLDLYFLAHKYASMRCNCKLKSTIIQFGVQDHYSEFYQAIKHCI